MSYVFSITLLDVNGKDLVKDICLYLLAAKLENSCYFCHKYIEKAQRARIFLCVHVFNLTFFLIDLS